MDIKNIILEEALELFFRKGTQCVTMDDVAFKCNISKKIIYKYFENKSDLLYNVIKFQAEKLQKYIKIIGIKSENSLEELTHFFKYINQVICKISDVFNKELKKYYPSNYIKVFKYKNEIIMPFVMKNIEKGKEQKLYRDDLNTKEICESFDNISKILFTDSVFFNSDINTNAINFLNTLFINRLVSLEGLELLKKYNTVS